MGYKNKRLQLKQLDEQLSKLKNWPAVPKRGWIKTIRKALGMSTTQLGQKIGVSHQAISQLEVREEEQAITLKKMEELASAMGMKFVYGIVPEDSLETMVEKQARLLAEKIVKRTSKHMALEDQKVRNQRIQEAIKERTEEMTRTMPRNLWD